MERDIKGILCKNYSLLAVLIGVVLVSLTISPFHNIDIDLEYQTALGVIKWGMPYYPTYGEFINQPPLGFYVEAAFFKGVGEVFDYGVALVTAFGLGTILLVYGIGKIWYGKRTGLLAAVLFAFSPWQLVLSRSFLIDVQCLFFSLLSLFVGVLAIRKNSFRLLVISGAVFAVAMLTKFYAVFVLVPLVLFFLYSKPRDLKRSILWVVSFFIPLFLGFFLWYQVISGQGLLAVFHHEDFLYYNSFVPSPFFVGNFLVNGLGMLFLVSAVLSVVLGLSARKHFGKIVIFDLMCLTTIVVAVGVNTYLGVVENLSSPYCNPIKYVYQSLPYFSLLAASLVGKLSSLPFLVKSRAKIWRLLVFLVVIGGVFLVAISLYRNMDFAHLFSTWNYLLFRAEENQSVGYSFFSPDAIGSGSPLMILQFLGFGFVLSGLTWAGRAEFSLLRSRLVRKELN